MQKSDCQVDISDETDGRGVPAAADIERWIAAAVQAVRGTPPRPVEVSLRVVSEDEIQGLNRDYRQRDKATNVLSFEAGDIAGLPEQATELLGDIVVCSAVIAEEARSQQKALQDHWAHMLIHGTLHLLGYDHERDADAEAMEALEVNILAAQGIADPYHVVS